MPSITKDSISQVLNITNLKRLKFLNMLSGEQMRNIDIFRKMYLSSVLKDG